VLRLAAHAYSQEQDNYVFVALADGSSGYEIELAWIPVAVVAKVRGG
jgi:hypothetical protein